MSATHPQNSEARRGVACAGNWIVDHVKLIDAWPKPGNLANILDEARGTGGAPFNVLIDLARLSPGFPLEAVGLVGDDSDGEWIRGMVGRYAREGSLLGVHPQVPTSYTDVMTVQSTGARTFFHMRGANERFDVDDVRVEAIRSRVFHLGYLLLLTALDGPDPEHGTRAARLLAKCRAAGLITSIDVVSAEGGRFAEIVVPALRHVDYCIINEVEAGGVTGIAPRDASGAPDWAALERAAAKMADLGVARNVTIHLPEGAVSLDVAAGRTHQSRSARLPEGFIKGTAGAGDAFCAGMLLGLHEGWEIDRALKAAHAAAVASLRHPTCTEGVGELSEALAIVESLESAKAGA